MSNPCQQATLLSAYLDGELSEAQTVEVKAHLADCPDCRRTVDTMRHTDTMIRDLAPLEPSAAFDRSFWTKVDAHDAKSRSRPWTRYLFGGWRPAWTGAMAGLAVAVLIYFNAADPLSPEEVFIAEHMEFLEEYDLIGQLEMLEHLEATDAMKELS